MKSTQVRLTVITLILILAASLGFLAALEGGPLPAQAADQAVTPVTTPTPGPNRKTTLTVNFTRFDWWVVRYSDNQVLCTVHVEHDGVPLGWEVLGQCGKDVHSLWKGTGSCQLTTEGQTTQDCSGAYFYLLGSQPGERQIEVDLSPPKVWVSLSRCEPVAPQNRCKTLPALLLTGEEPLPNELITSIQGVLDGRPFSCNGATCEVVLQPTGPQGATIEFWADSSYGDSSEHYTAQVRAVPWGDFTAPEGQSSDPQLWYVDVLSTQWRGAPLASCSQTWESFPDVGGPPAWLTTPDKVSDLNSNLSLYYLAGMLIDQGLIPQAAECENQGLQAPGVANACGLQMAQEKVTEWQNRFDDQIVQVAKDTHIPAQLMKNIFSRESQLWPGIFTSFREAGLGQMTENGADTVLLWNPDFYNQFCPLVLADSVCGKGFLLLHDDERALLRGALVHQVNASCVDCATGIDLTKANFSIGIFAQTLQANCEQVGRTLQNVTGMPAGQVSSYVDLWRFTLVNYNAGVGCLVKAVRSAWVTNLPLTWQNVAMRLEPACQKAIDYVHDITNGDTPLVTPIPWTPTVTPRPTSTAGPTPTRTLTPTGTLTVYPSPSTSPSPSITPTATTAGYP